MLNLVKLLAGLALLITLPQASSGQEPVEKPERLPLSTPNYETILQPQLLTIPQQRAKFAADQRMLRLEWNNWIGYSPLRPNVNASYMSQRAPRYYIPSRGVIVNSGAMRSWYW